MTDNIAHRGGAALWPENTMAAFARAFELGCDGVEMDVQLTKDGEVAIFHDNALKPEIVRDARGAWLEKPGPRISEMSFADLQQFDIGRLKPGTAYGARNPNQQAFDGERIPALRDLVRLAKEAGGKKLWIELKTPLMGGEGQEHPHRLADAVLDLLRAESALELATLCAFDWAGVVRAKSREPAADVRFLTVPQSTFAENERMRDLLARGAPWETGFHAKDHGGVLGAIKAAGGDGWYGFYPDVTEEAAAECRKLGLKYAAWTVNEADEMSRLIALGTDAVCSDRPDVLKDVLARG